MPAPDEENRVGYCRPPKTRRFKKGISGNPAGRPKKLAPGISDIVDRFTSEPVAFTEGGEKKIATRDEVGLKALRKHAIAGNLGAAEQIIKVLGGNRGRGLRKLFRIVGGLPE